MKTLAKELVQEALKAESKGSRSQLEPFIECIAILKGKGWTHLEITSFLNSKGIAIKPVTLGGFCNRRKAQIKSLARQLATSEAKSETEKPRKHFSFTGLDE